MRRGAGGAGAGGTSASHGTGTSPWHPVLGHLATSPSPVSFRSAALSDHSPPRRRQSSSPQAGQRAASVAGSGSGAGGGASTFLLLGDHGLEALALVQERA